MTVPDVDLPAALVRTHHVKWIGGVRRNAERTLPEETAIALTYNRASYAVMMATPCDLEDFAVGFSLNEGVVQSVDEIEELEVVAGHLGIEARMWIGHDLAEALRRRQRRLAGPTGCGLCGLDSLAQAMRPVRAISAEAAAFSTTTGEIRRAVAALAAAQPMNVASRAMHAAGFWVPGRGYAAVREDVGRHNALDKLAGALARLGASPSSGLLVMTSRVSVELVQKAAAMGMPILVAVSVPTALALRTAAAADITLAGIARDDGFEVFTCPARIRDGAAYQRVHDAA